MKYNLDALERSFDVSRIDEVAFNKLDVLRDGRKIAAMTCAKIVEHAHSITALDQRGRNV